MCNCICGHVVDLLSACERTLGGQGRVHIQFGEPVGSPSAVGVILVVDVGVFVWAVAPAHAPLAGREVSSPQWEVLTISFTVKHANLHRHAENCFSWNPFKVSVNGFGPQRWPGAWYDVLTIYFLCYCHLLSCLPFLFLSQVLGHEMVVLSQSCCFF